MTPLISTGPPLILFEDDHLLVVQKPAGVNTHAPDPFAGEGLYDWLRHREPRWASLAILHRLDKETSGVMVFGKTPLANRSLTRQFAQHLVRKKYLLLTDRPMKQDSFAAISVLVRAGEKYLARPLHAGGERAETRFRVVNRRGDRSLVEAEPVTGRTHQIRAHAAATEFPILGDTLYGGTPWPRLCLHAHSLTLQSPDNGEWMAFEAAADFFGDSRLALRAAMIEPGQTDAFRLVHGASDGWPGWYLDRLGEFLLSQSEQGLTAAQRQYLETFPEVAGVYHKILNRQLRRAGVIEVSPQLAFGRAAPERFAIGENGVRFEISFNDGYSVGLFLDQRDNRRRLMVNHVAAEFPLFADDVTGRAVLNTFAYTCGFSVCAARSGARTTNIDLSRKHLETGRRNFELNGMDPAGHEFFVGDVFDWLNRLAKKNRRFNVVVLDPPTFSQSKQHGIFQAEKDYAELVGAALPLLKPEGVLFASTNAAKLKPNAFLEIIAAAIRAGHRQIVRRHYAPQPPDYPVTRSEPAYLKTVWLRVA